ncbi:MAG: DUF1905 domain-containing protein [Sediminibacterium sp.]
MNGKIKYEFSARSWQHSPAGGWYFVSLPTDIAKEIRENLGWQEEGWGRLKARAKIGNSEWDTAIWFDTKQKTYLLPLKSEIRRKEKIEAGKKIKTIIWL